LTASRKGRLVVISGPSGVGKSSIVEAVLARTDARFSVSATTRPARPREIEGVDYRFVTADAFDRLRSNGDLLEWATYGGNQYGTPADGVLAMIAEGHDVILDIENEGAKQVKAAYPDALMIFVKPPNPAVLAERLMRRGDTPDEDMERRLAVAAQQTAEADAMYDHIVVNEDLVDAITEVLDILKQPADLP
jgi:guanylate kinase